MLENGILPHVDWDVCVDAGDQDQPFFTHYTIKAQTDVEAINFGKERFLNTILKGDTNWPMKGKARRI